MPHLWIVELMIFPFVKRLMHNPAFPYDHVNEKKAATFVNEVGLTEPESEKFFQLLRDLAVPDIQIRSLRDIKRKIADGVPQVPLLSQN